MRPLQLTGKDEPQGKYKDFPYSFLEQRSVFRKAEYNPISIAGVIDRRMYAPEDVIDAWRFHAIRTGDSSVCGRKGDALISLDDPFILDLNLESKLHDFALILSDEQWKYLRSQKDKVLHLTAEEVQEAYGKGYVRKGGVWTPANETVRKIYEGANDFPGLFRGEIEIQKYAQLVSKKSNENNYVMRLYLNRTIKNGKPTRRSLVVHRIDLYSVVDGNLSLGDNGGRLVGVAPEAPRERSGPKEGTEKMTAYRGEISVRSEQPEIEVTEEQKVSFYANLKQTVGKLFK